MNIDLQPAPTFGEIHGVAEVRDKDGNLKSTFEFASELTSQDQVDFVKSLEGKENGSDPSDSGS